MNTEIDRRRTFAIIAHPDAGKTSLTEKLLLFGGQIQVAGAVKSNKIKKTATSDWMDIEKQRGISVTTSVMEFDYHDYKINILDTPGHQDFAEDTYRTLTAVDSVIIVVDGAKGVETQTRKLMEVCRMRNTPVIIFVNKMDREAKDPFDLLDELEEELHIHVRPLTWPIESGVRFKGVYNIYEQNLNLFQPSKQVVAEKVAVDIHTEELDRHIGSDLADKLRSELELIDGVYPEFTTAPYLQGELAPVFFGSALNNFGVEELLNTFVEIAPSPRPVKAEEVTEHHMHSEFCMMPRETADILNETKRSGGRIVCVGTTSCRTLESLAKDDGAFEESSAWTEIFIYPGYRFKAMDALITNFHLPESTLVMLVSAFAGREHVLNAYNVAVRERYRFFSFGDAMFIA